MKWALVGVIVGATTVGEVLQAIGMRRHGEIRDFRLGALGRLLSVLVRNWMVVASVVAMAVSFFAYLGLLTVSELSFAVPVTAVTCVLETVLAKYVLKEHVSWLRWAGASLVVFGVALVSA
ncbi:MAG TPA: EamA family transporter [Bryobacteraceae bacterium]|nr:EamA family transporter [Bryobacteraceae bacterium]